jgi:homoserine O-acetyltransferase
MPGQTDLYFPPEDSQYEVSKMPNAEYRPIPSIWGHQAGGAGLNPVDAKFVNAALADLLER